MLTKMLDRMFAKRGQLIIAGQVPGADQPAESLRAGIVRKFSLRLDLQVAVFHGQKIITTEHTEITE